MNKFINKIQNKPRSARILMLWISTATVMIIIFLIWLFSFSRTFKPQQAKEGVEQTNLPSLFESLGKDFSTFKSQIESSIGDINEQISSQGENLEQNLQPNEGQ